MSEREELSTDEYREAVSSRYEDVRQFTVAYDWHDKPHRLVYDLCKEVDRLRAVIKKLEASCQITTG